MSLLTSGGADGDTDEFDGYTSVNTGLTSGSSNDEVNPSMGDGIVLPDINWEQYGSHGSGPAVVSDEGTDPVDEDFRESESDDGPVSVTESGDATPFTAGSGSTDRGGSGGSSSGVDVSDLPLGDIQPKVWIGLVAVVALLWYSGGGS